MEASNGGWPGWPDHPLQNHSWTPPHSLHTLEAFFTHTGDDSLYKDFLEWENCIVLIIYELGSSIFISIHFIFCCHNFVLYYT